jgi:hypothetical protein
MCMVFIGYNTMVCLVQEDSKPGPTGGLHCVQNQEIPRGFVKNHVLYPMGNQNSQYPPRKTAQYYVLLDQHMTKTIPIDAMCAAGFALLNLPKGKSLGRSKP